MMEKTLYNFFVSLSPIELSKIRGKGRNTSTKDKNALLKNVAEIEEILSKKNIEISIVEKFYNEANLNLDEEYFFKEKHISFRKISANDNLPDCLGVSVRLLNRLKTYREELGINYENRDILASELSKISIRKFSNFKNVGKKTIWELKALCYHLNYQYD